MLIAPQVLTADKLSFYVCLKMEQAEIIIRRTSCQNSAKNASRQQEAAVAYQLARALRNKDKLIAFNDVRIHAKDLMPKSTI